MISRAYTYPIMIAWWYDHHNKLLDKRVLINTDSSSDILFAEAFDQLKISRDGLRPVATPLVGFNGPSPQPLGMIELSVLMGTHA